MPKSLVTAPMMEALEPRYLLSGAINHAPTVGVAVLTVQLPAGQPTFVYRVSDLVALAGGSDVDPDTDLGIAFLGASGNLQCSLDGGQTWSTVKGNLLLGSDAQIRLQSNQFEGFTFHLWDQSQGTSGNEPSGDMTREGLRIGGSSALSEHSVFLRLVPELPVSFTRQDLGDGLYGWTFTLNDPSNGASSWAANITFAGCNGAQIIQQTPDGGEEIDTEALSNQYSQQLAYGYDKTRDSWVFSPFMGLIDGVQEGDNSYTVHVGSQPGFKLGTTNLAYIVSDGDISWTGTFARLGQMYDTSGETDAVPADVTEPVVTIDKTYPPEQPAPVTPPVVNPPPVVPPSNPQPPAPIQDPAPVVPPAPVQAPAPVAPPSNPQPPAPVVDPAPVVPPSDPQPLEVVVHFTDPNLAQAIRKQLGLAPSADITQEELLGLIELDPSGCNIRDLTGLEYAANLQGLDLSLNHISDLSPLANLVSLSYLNLEGNQISDLSPLAQLASLTWLNLGSNNISDLSPLANLLAMNRLWIEYNQISDITALANMTSLTELWADGNHIRDLSPLEDLTSLTGLTLTGSQVRDVSPLAKLTSLYVLYLSNNQISDLSPIANLTSLSFLMLDSNQISDVSPLGDLTSLTFLTLSGNHISDVSSLASLTSLFCLDLSGNQVSDASCLADLTSTCVDLYNNPVSDTPSNGDSGQDGTEPATGGNDGSTWDPVNPPPTGPGADPVITPPPSDPVVPPDPVIAPPPADPVKYPTYTKNEAVVPMYVTDPTTGEQVLMGTFVGTQYTFPGDLVLPSSEIEFNPGTGCEIALYSYTDGSTTWVASHTPDAPLPIDWSAMKPLSLSMSWSGPSGGTSGWRLMCLDDKRNTFTFSVTVCTREDLLQQGLAADMIYGECVPTPEEMAQYTDPLNLVICINPDPISIQGPLHFVPYPNDPPIAGLEPVEYPGWPQEEYPDRLPQVFAPVNGELQFAGTSQTGTDALAVTDVSGPDAPANVSFDIASGSALGRQTLTNAPDIIRNADGTQFADRTPLSPEAVSSLADAVSTDTLSIASALDAVEPLQLL